MQRSFGGDDLFVLKVRGQSMIEGHIADGDYVVIRKKETCDNGEKVVAMVDKAMTLKKYYKKKDQIQLHPMNSTMEPIVVDPTPPGRADPRRAGRRHPEVLNPHRRHSGNEKRGPDFGAVFVRGDSGLTGHGTD